MCRHHPSLPQAPPPRSPSSAKLVGPRASAQGQNSSSGIGSRERSWARGPWRRPSLYSGHCPDFLTQVCTRVSSGTILAGARGGLAGLANIEGETRGTKRISLKLVGQSSQPPPPPPPASPPSGTLGPKTDGSGSMGSALLSEHRTTLDCPSHEWPLQGTAIVPNPPLSASRLEKIQAHRGMHNELRGSVPLSNVFPGLQLHMTCW